MPATSRSAAANAQTRSNSRLPPHSRPMRKAARNQQKVPKAIFFARASLIVRPKLPRIERPSSESERHNRKQMYICSCFCRNSATRFRRNQQTALRPPMRRRGQPPVAFPLKNCEESSKRSAKSAKNHCFRWSIAHCALKDGEAIIRKSTVGS